jgi:hypothetical protein
LLPYLLVPNIGLTNTTRASGDLFRGPEKRSDRLRVADGVPQRLLTFRALA